jgi:hypothetical protein
MKIRSSVCLMKSVAWLSCTKAFVSVTGKYNNKPLYIMGSPTNLAAVDFKYHLASKGAFGVLLSEEDPVCGVKK